ncbi:MAG TPA: aminoacyl-tRNA hydrolase [Candidatus Acidoferrales bacterium]|nr:aminoacyl-tRNA hydrolase [Candidatus Acidoferrales bacterium]
MRSVLERASSRGSTDGSDARDPSAAQMRLIVGLGNPGPEYAWTPHNLGFLVVDRLAEAGRIRVERPEARACIGRGQLAGKKVLLVKPQTFMNVSGLAVRELLGRFESDPAEMIAIYDDVALPWGYLRIRKRGSAGGHKGLKSLIGALGTDEFVRVRLGVRPEHPVGDLAAYVLSPMSRDQLEVAGEMVEQAAEAVGVILAEGVERAMNRFNRRVPPAGEVQI